VIKIRIDNPHQKQNELNFYILIAFFLFDGIERRSWEDLDVDLI
jgi:hypothetical protein